LTDPEIDHKTFMSPQPPPRPGSAAPGGQPSRPGTAAPGTTPSDFNLFRPNPIFEKTEVRGDLSWTGGSLPPIEAEGSLPFVDLPRKLIDLVHHCWKSASVSQTATRGRLHIAAGRQAALDKIKNSWQPADIIAAANLQRQAGYTKQVQPLTHNSAVTNLAPHMLDRVPTDWKVMDQLKRVNAYTFRGDSRAPAAIKAADGFHPPITRSDQYYVDSTIFPQFAGYLKRRFDIDLSKEVFDRVYREKVASAEDKAVLRNFFVWRTLLDNEAYHLGRMLADETLKGYVSTSKSTTVAKGFAKDGGWVYVTRVRGGFVVPDKNKIEWTKVFGEQEIALPAPLLWSDVFGYRQVGPRDGSSKMFVGPLWLRRGFQAANGAAFQQCADLLSGKRQN
jgi:hypothetical protein